LIVIKSICNITQIVKGQVQEIARDAGNPVAAGLAKGIRMV